MATLTGVRIARIGPLVNPRSTDSLHVVTQNLICVLHARAAMGAAVPFRAIASDIGTG